MVDAGWLVAKVTCVVLEPDGFEVDGRGQVKDVRIASLQQVRDDHLRPETHTREGGGGLSDECVCSFVCACMCVCVCVVRQVRSPQVDPQHQVDLLHGRLQSSRQTDGAGVVHQDVDPCQP